MNQEDNIKQKYMEETIEIKGKKYRVLFVDDKPTLEEVNEEPNTYDKAYKYLKNKGEYVTYEHDWFAPQEYKGRSIQIVAALGRLLTIIEAMHDYYGVKVDIENKAFIILSYIIEPKSIYLDVQNKYVRSPLIIANEKIAESIASIEENQELIKIYLGV